MSGPAAQVHPNHRISHTCAATKAASIIQHSVSRVPRNCWLTGPIWNCTFVGECSVVCPKNVDPAGAIQQAKVESTIDWYTSLLPWTKK